MNTINVPTENQVDEKSQLIFQQLESKLGMLPNLYAVIGYSSNQLKHFLTFSENAGGGIFSNKEIEAIKLAVSEQNNCDYCKAAHTTMARMNGFSEEETLELRAGSISNKKLKVLTTLGKEVAANAGRASLETKSRFFELGYDVAALIEFVAIVVSVTFTNYVFGLTQVPIDFPLAPSLELQEA